jgi:hypothetical protein
VVIRLALVALISAVSIVGYAKAEDKCTGLLQTAILCRLSPSDGSENILPPRAAGALSAFVEARIASLARLDDKLDNGAVERSLLSLLPNEELDHCNKATHSASTAGIVNGFIACFRPTCLDPANHSLPECLPIGYTSSSDYDSLRASLSASQSQVSAS